MKTPKPKPPRSSLPPAPVPLPPSPVRECLHIPLDRLVVDPDQPRKHFDPEGLAILAESLRRRGQLQPVRVRPAGEGDYFIVCGERRYRAALAAGLATLIAIVHEGPLSEDDLRVIQLVENCAREDLEPMDQARALKALVDRGLSQRAIAEETGLSQGKVAKSLALLDLAKPVQRLVEAGTLAPSSATVLARVGDKREQATMAREVIRGHLNRDEVEGLVRDRDQAKTRSVIPRESPGIVKCGSEPDPVVEDAIERLKAMETELRVIPPPPSPPSPAAAFEPGTPVWWADPGSEFHGTPGTVRDEGDEPGTFRVLFSGEREPWLVEIAGKLLATAPPAMPDRPARPATPMKPVDPRLAAALEFPRGPGGLYRVEDMPLPPDPEPTAPADPWVVNDFGSVLELTVEPVEGNTITVVLRRGQPAADLVPLLEQALRLARARRPAGLQPGRRVRCEQPGHAMHGRVGTVWDMPPEPTGSVWIRWELPGGMTQLYPAHPDCLVPDATPPGTGAGGKAVAS